MKKDRTRSKGETRLYNVLFPVWFLFLIPSVWLLIIPANFVIDSLVLLAALVRMKLPDKKEIYTRSILRIFCVGFAADCIAALLLLGAAFLVDRAGLPFSLFGGIGCVIGSLPFIALAGWLIYRLNRKYSFQKTGLPEDRVRKISLVLAIATAPYVMMIPTYW